MARILIVDDEAADRLLAQAILERAGHEIVVAEDGDDVLGRALLKSVDIVVTDLQMPEVHGFELISSLRELSAPPPVIAVSGTGPYQLEMAEALGAKFTLSKPINPHALLTAVEQLLRYRAPRSRQASGGGDPGPGLPTP